MKYVIRNPEPWGEVVSLYSAADAMSQAFARSANGGFNEAAYEGRLKALIVDLVTEARKGALKVCNQRGIPRPLADVLAEAKSKRAIPRSDNVGLAAAIHVTINQLNEWGRASGLEFCVDHSGVEWLDELGRHPKSNSEPQPQSSLVGSVKSSAVREAWIEKAQKLANEIIVDFARRDLYPSQRVIADQIAVDFRSQQITGPSGKPMTGEYIKRHALKGIFSNMEKRKLKANPRSKRSKN